MRLYARNAVRSPRKKWTPLLTFTLHSQSFSPPVPQSSRLPIPSLCVSAWEKGPNQGSPITDTVLHLPLTLPPCPYRFPSSLNWFPTPPPKISHPSSFLFTEQWQKMLLSKLTPVLLRGKDCSLTLRSNSSWRRRTPWQ